MTVHETVIYDVEDFKVALMLTDTTGAPTYAPVIDVPGIGEVSMDPNIVTAELKGDARVIAKKGRIDKFNFSATYGKLSLDALEVFVGGDVTDAVGSAEWEFGGTNSLNNFKAMFRILDADVASVKVTAYKCTVTGGSLLSQSSDNFGQPSIDFEAIPCNSDPTLFLAIGLYDTVVELT